MTIREASILLVDDEPDYLEIYTAWLSDAGCNDIFCADNSDLALEMLRARPFDLLISDINMPRMDGPTMLRRLSQCGTVPSTILASGFDAPDPRELHHLGVRAFLSKPMRRQEVVDAANNALAQRQECWLNPMIATPRQSISLMEQWDSAAEQTSPIVLGQGGFMAHYSGPLTKGAVSFRCELPHDEGELNGQGYIRWRSKVDQRIGIEFAYIEPLSRAGVIEGIAAMRSQCFIPGLG